MKTPLLLLLLLLTGTVLCESDDNEETQSVTEGTEEALDAGGDVNTEATEPLPTEPSSAPDPSSTDEDGSGDSETPVNPTTEDTASMPEEEEGLNPTIILIPVVLVVLIIGMIVCGIFINRRWNRKARNQELRKEDPYLDGPSTEKVPMPMFEEDVPSVLELEMEELGQWMKKDGDTADDSKNP